MFLTDGGLPVNGSMLVGGVGQLALSPRPLCASPSDFSSHSWWILRVFFPHCLISQLTFRKKRHSCIFYLTRRTNMFCFREDIDLVHHTQICLLEQFVSLAFVVSSQPSLYSLCPIPLLLFLLKPEAWCIRRCRNTTKFLRRVIIRFITKSEDTAQQQKYAKSCACTWFCFCARASFPHLQSDHKSADLSLLQVHRIGIHDGR